MCINSIAVISKRRAYIILQCYYKLELKISWFLQIYLPLIFSVINISVFIFFFFFLFQKPMFRTRCGVHSQSSSNVSVEHLSTFAQFISELLPYLSVSFKHFSNFYYFFPHFLAIIGYGIVLRLVTIA